MAPSVGSKSELSISSVITGRLCEVGPDPKVGIDAERRDSLGLGAPEGALQTEQVPVGAHLHLSQLDAFGRLWRFLGQLESGARNERGNISHCA